MEWKSIDTGQPPHATKQSFTISLRVRHPSRSERLIAESLGMTPKVSQMVGAPRVTRDGESLDGVYKQTFCVFDLIDRRSGWFEDGVAELLPLLDTHRSSFKNIADTGGYSELYVGVFVDSGDTTGFSLSTAVLNALATLPVQLAAEFYWG